MKLFQILTLILYCLLSLEAKEFKIVLANYTPYSWINEKGNAVDEKVREESLKTGNAGKRIACGVIGYKKD